MEEDDFRFLCSEYVAHNGSAAYRDILLPWVPRAKALLQPLEFFRKRNAAVNPCAVAVEDLWKWYALSRLSDYLILHLTPPPDIETEDSEIRLSPVTGEQYRAFFRALSFSSFGAGAYHPFRHEIVEIIEDADWRGQPTAEQIFWPGLMFGEMLFARAGVRLRCRPGAFDKRIAENSRLYFAYWRRRREASDLSHGWGHNSQWRTAFRRDYDSDGSYFFNVDGEHPLGDEDAYKASFTPSEWRRNQEEKTIHDLTMAERIELLTHRCFVRCAKDDKDCWPYDDSYILRQ